MGSCCDLSLHLLKGAETWRGSRRWRAHSTAASPPRLGPCSASEEAEFTLRGWGAVSEEHRALSHGGAHRLCLAVEKPGWASALPDGRGGPSALGSGLSSPNPSLLCPQVLHYVEKPSTFVSDIINCGIYLFSPEALKPLRDVFQRNQQDGQL